MTEDLEAKREELARVMRDIAVARQVSDTLLAHARAILSQAEADAAAMLEEARTLAQAALAAAGIR